MKLVIIEPLGVEKETLLEIADKAVGGDTEIVYYDTRVTDDATLIERGKDADIIVVANLPLNETVIDGCRNLKLLAVAFTGIDHIIPCNEVVRKSGTKDGLVGFELEGKKFGVIGTGAIGSRVAAIAQAFGCEVYAYSRTRKDLPGVIWMELGELLETCDIISLHVPLNEKTREMIGEAELAKMKPGAVLINTARGPVVDSTALAKALNDGKIAGAAVDVFETEPPVPEDHPLLHAKNLIATPHVAFATKEALIKRAIIDFDNVRKYLDGTPQNVM